MKKHQLTRGVSTEARDRYSLLNDPGLKVLKDRYFKDIANATDKLGERVTRTYFESAGAAMGMPAEATGVYAPTWFDRNTPEFAFDLTEPFYLTWKTDETEPKVKTFEAAQPEVVAAWKRVKAREFAEKATKDLQKRVTDQGIKDLATLKDFAEKNNIPLVEMDPIAKNKMHPSPVPNMPAFYLPPTIPAEKVEYASNEMIKQILDMRDKSRGETTVVHDGPKSKFYVAVLLGVEDVQEFEFQQVFAKSADGTKDQILERFELTHRFEHRRAVIAQLRAAAKVTTVPEEMKKHNDRGAGDVNSDE